MIGVGLEKLAGTPVPKISPGYPPPPPPPREPCFVESEKRFKRKPSRSSIKQDDVRNVK